MRNLLLLLLAGCGGAPAPRPAAPSTPKPSALAAALADRGPTAMVTFAAFLPGAPPDEVDAPKGLAIVPASVDAELPLDVASLAAAVDRHGEAIAAAKGVVLVRFAGQREPDFAHVRRAAEAAVAQGGVVVDLGLRRAWTADELRAALSGDAWATEQIGLHALEAEDGTVSFVSLGMPRLGLPDLELSGVEKPDAHAAFERFQKALRALQAKKRAKPGDALGDETLKPCVRPPEAYEQDCVAL